MGLAEKLVCIPKGFCCTTTQVKTLHVVLQRVWNAQEGKVKEEAEICVSVQNRPAVLPELICMEAMPPENTD